jgi:hypothetical protein
VHPFRFGLVAGPRGTGEQWVATARRASDLGFGTLLVPDGLALHAPCRPGPRPPRPSRAFGSARTCWPRHSARPAALRGRRTA